MMQTYPYGKQSYLKDMSHSAKVFQEGRISPTGLICGSHAPRSQSDAYHLEAPYDDEELSSLGGDRRFAWIWPQDIKSRYDKGSRELTLDFVLPKGAYATTFLEEIGKRSLKPAMSREHHQ